MWSWWTGVRWPEVDVSSVAPVSDGSDDLLADETVSLVATWLERARAGETDEDRDQAGRLADVVADPDGVAFTMGYVDRVARPDDDRVAADQLASLVAGVDLPGFLSPVDRLLLRAGAALGPRAPGLIMPLARRRMRQLVGHLVVDAEPAALARHLSRRRADGYALNVNLLGEAVLGHSEADGRLRASAALVDQPSVDYVSVKISSVCAQLHPWAFDHDVDRIVDRLRVLFERAAAADPPTFVNLDMEEYRDLDLTVAAFTALLDEPALRSVDAGIVLQAYLPDSYAALRHLVDWAGRRHRAGGGSVKIRLVKGANLAMERLEAAMHGWPQTPYRSKTEVDANYKRCLDWVLRPDRTEGVRIGVASHNLFDVAWAHLLSVERGVADRVELEMLQGMAPALARVARAASGGLLLYTPTVASDDFDVAIGYLFRRLEETSAPGNFLRVLHGLRPGTGAFDREAGRFRRALAARWAVSSSPRRTQDRSVPDAGAVHLGGSVPDAGADGAGFRNEPDTDPALAANRAWAAEMVSAPAPAPMTPMLASVGEVDAVVARAVSAWDGWRRVSAGTRRDLLRAVGDELAARRGELVTAMVHEGAKTIGEADPEVSEAVDFARYYAERAPELDELADVRFEPLGVVAVVPPWNFPVAIPAGGVTAALAAGNTVILKPSTEVPRCSEIIVEACRAAGVPDGVVQVARCPDDEVGRRLVTHPDVGGVILTGAYETAELFRSWRPDLRLFAETSGKNAIVVTPQADLDLAVADLVTSAFGHSGQKCSAASLAICVGSVYGSRRFRRQLADAVTSLAVGPADDLATAMGPTIAPVDGELGRALTTLDPGEEWLVEPRPLDGTGRLWSPGVRLGVAPGSWFHRTECFGPVLGLMAAADLDEAVRLQNDTPYGLTGGIHTLDPAEIDHWLDRVEVGNAYVNRGITGAIVRRQPFGGWKRSAVGPGAKAGGPDYVAQLGTWHPTHEPGGLLERAFASDEHWWTARLAVGHDPTGLAYEANVLRYRPRPRVAVRVTDPALADELVRVLAAAERCGVPVDVSDVAFESDDAFAARLADLAARGVDRVRVIGTVPADLRAAAHAAGVDVADAPVTANGRLELAWFLREQTVSRTLHRFGNLAASPGAVASDRT